MSAAKIATGDWVRIVGDVDPERTFHVLKVEGTLVTLKWSTGIAFQQKLRNLRKV